LQERFFLFYSNSNNNARNSRNGRGSLNLTIFCRLSSLIVCLGCSKLRAFLHATHHQTSHQLYIAFTLVGLINMMFAFILPLSPVSPWFNACDEITSVDLALVALSPFSCVLLLLSCVGLGLFYTRVKVTFRILPLRKRCQSKCSLLITMALKNVALVLALRCW